MNFENCLQLHVSKCLLCPLKSLIASKRIVGALLVAGTGSRSLGGFLYRPRSRSARSRGQNYFPSLQELTTWWDVFKPISNTWQVSLALLFSWEDYKWGCWHQDEKMGKGKKCLVSLFKLALSGPLSSSLCLFLSLSGSLALSGSQWQAYPTLSGFFRCASISWFQVVSKSLSNW